MLVKSGRNSLRAANPREYKAENGYYDVVSRNSLRAANPREPSVRPLQKAAQSRNSLRAANPRETKFVILIIASTSQ